MKQLVAFILCVVIPAAVYSLVRTLVQLVRPELLGSELSEPLVMLAKGSLEFLNDRTKFVVRSADGLPAEFTDTVFQTPAHNSGAHHTPALRRLRIGNLGYCTNHLCGCAPS